MVDNCVVINMSDFYEYQALHLLIAITEEESGSSHSSDEALFVSSRIVTLIMAQRDSLLQFNTYTNHVYMCTLQYFIIIMLPITVSIVTSIVLYTDIIQFSLPQSFYISISTIPYSRKILRAKIFEVALPQNISRIKFRGSTRLSLHLYAIIRFSRINFGGSSEIHENSEIYCPRKILAIRYNVKVFNQQPRVYLCQYHYYVHTASSLLIANAATLNFL